MGGKPPEKAATESKNELSGEERVKILWSKIRRYAAFVARYPFNKNIMK